MDFYQIKEKQKAYTVEEESVKRKIAALEIYPDFSPIRSTDLMVRGRSFYAIWDEAKQIWSTDEADVQRMVDQ